jgi:hypothetical protein
MLQYFYVMLMLVFCSCVAKKPVVAGIPTCIQQQVDSIKAQPKWNPPAEIDEYVYDGRTVYVVSAPCCDIYNKVVDANCNYLCAPSGGITGKGDGKCKDFQQQAKFVKVVWKDER